MTRFLGNNIGKLIACVKKIVIVIIVKDIDTKEKE